MAADNPYITGMVWINPVRVCAVQRVQYADALNQYIITARRVQRPEGGILHCNACKGDVIAVLHITHGRARVEIPIEIIGAYTLHKSVNIAVDCALSCDRKVVRILCIKECITWLECDRTVNRCRSGNRSVPGFCAVGMEIRCDIGMCFQQAALLQMKVYI